MNTAGETLECRHHWNWFKSYLSNKVQCVSINNSLSKFLPVQSGISHTIMVLYSRDNIFMNFMKKLVFREIIIVDILNSYFKWSFLNTDS